MVQTYHLRIPITEEDSSIVAFRLIEDLRDVESFSISLGFLDELEEYARRNKIPCGDSQPQVCLRCLKAHAKWLLSDQSKDKSNLVLSLFNCPTGHNGYYRDEETIRNVT